MRSGRRINHASIALAGYLLCDKVGFIAPFSIADWACPAEFIWGFRLSVAICFVTDLVRFHLIFKHSSLYPLLAAERTRV